MGRYSRRGRRPSEFRFLVGTMYGGLALVIAFALTKLDSAVCSMITRWSPGASCSVVPPAAMQVLVIAAAAGALYSVYRFYRDFYAGDYYADLAERGYL